MIGKRCLLTSGDCPQHPLPHGAVAQLIERFVRNEEVVGLIPICSTTFPIKWLQGPQSARMQQGLPHISQCRAMCRHGESDAGRENPRVGMSQISSRAIADAPRGPPPSAPPSQLSGLLLQPSAPPSFRRSAPPPFRPSAPLRPSVVPPLRLSFQVSAFSPSVLPPPPADVRPRV